MSATPDHVTAAELDEVEHWHAILVSGSSSAELSSGAQDHLNDLGCSLLPRLATELRTIDDMLTEAGIGHHDNDTTRDRVARMIADVNTEGLRTVAAEEKVAVLRAALEVRDDEDTLADADTQRLAGRCAEQETTIAKLREIIDASDPAKALRIENDRLHAQVRALTKQHDEGTTT